MYINMKENWRINLTVFIKSVCHFYCKIGVRYQQLLWLQYFFLYCKILTFFRTYIIWRLQYDASFFPINLGYGLRHRRYSSQSCPARGDFQHTKGWTAVARVEWSVTSGSFTVPDVKLNRPDVLRCHKYWCFNITIVGSRVDGKSDAVYVIAN